MGDRPLEVAVENRLQGVPRVDENPLPNLFGNEDSIAVSISFLGHLISPGSAPDP